MGGYLETLRIRLTAEISQLKERLMQGEGLVRAFSLAAAGAFLAVSTAAFAAGLAIDDAMDGIRISTGATGSALAGLEGSFGRVFANVPNSAGDASSALAQLSVRTGQTGVGLENLTTQALTLARITKSDLNATITDSAQVFNSWGIEASKQAGTLDMVLRAHQQTGIAVGSLLQTMVTAGPVFRAAGFDFATSAALLGSFERAGVNGQRAVASLTAAFRFFAKEGIDAQTGVAQTIARIQELGPGAASAALGVKVFGRSAVDMVAAIQAGRLNVEELTAAISGGSETIAAAAAATDGFTETLAKLRNNAVLALEPFGTAILGTFNAAMVGILAPSRALLATLDLLAKAAIALSIAMGTRVVVSFVAATRAKVADLLASQAARVAAVQYTGAVAAQAQAQLVAATAALNAARAETALTGSLVAQRAALVSVGTAHAQAAAATAAHTAAMNAASISARLAAGSVNLLKGALAFFGGPIGLAITAVLTAVGIAFYNTGKRAREAAAAAQQAASDFRAAISTMDEASFGAAAAVTRQNYRRTRDLIGQQESSITRAQALLEQARQADRAASTYGAGKGLAPEASAATRAAEAGLRREQANLEHLNRSRRRYADGVIAVREQEAALARQRLTMPDPNTGGGPGPLAWEGKAEENAKRFAETLRERVGLLTEVAEAQRQMGADTSSVIAEVNRLYQSATARLSGMGDAARLSPEALKDWQDFANTISQVQNSGLLGLSALGEQFGDRMRVAMHTAKAAADSALRPALRLAAEEFAARIKNIKAPALSGILREMPFADRLERLTATIRDNLKEGAQEAANALVEASERVSGMWSGLLSGAPQQLGNFFSMFDALGKKRKEQEKDADGDGVGATGLAPFPGAVAFALAAEALAPVLEALREPFAALMVPLQMATAAFGPLLTSVVKALFPVMKLFGIAVTYVAQVAGYVGGALLKVVGEIIRTVGSLISKIPGLGEEGNAIKNFGKGLTDASREMFEMAASMPAVRDELRNLDWDEAMRRASESANRLADSLTNVPAIFDLIARRAQVMRGTGAQSVPPMRSSVDLSPAPAPSPAYQQQGASAAPIVVHNTVNIPQGAIVVNGGDPREVEKQFRRFKDELVDDMLMKGTNKIQRAIASVKAKPA